MISRNAQLLFAELFPLNDAAILKTIQMALEKETQPLQAEIESMKKVVNDLQQDVADKQTKLNAAVLEVSRLRAAAMPATEPQPPTPPDGPTDVPGAH